MERDYYVFTLADENAIDLLVDSRKYKAASAEALVAKWRCIATDFGCSYPVAALVRGGFTLQNHAPKFGPCYKKLSYFKEWKLHNSEPTKNSIVFWIPRLVEDSTCRTPFQMKLRRTELGQRYGLPEHHCHGFGSIALLFALILSHFKRANELVPGRLIYAVSDTIMVGGHRLIAGYYRDAVSQKDELRCAYWDGAPYKHIGFFPIGVEELDK